MGDNDYRVRATRAEQESAKLREELAKRPNYEWFVELVRKHLKQEEDVCPQRLAHQVKQLKEASTKRRQNRECAEDELCEIIDTLTDALSMKKDDMKDQIKKVIEMLEYKQHELTQRAEHAVECTK